MASNPDDLTKQAIWKMNALKQPGDFAVTFRVILG